MESCYDRYISIFYTDIKYIFECGAKVQMCLTFSPYIQTEQQQNTFS